MEDKVKNPMTWPELGIDLFDKLTGRKAEITYEFENFEVEVPNTYGPNPEYGKWKVNGNLRIRTKEEVS